MKQVWFLFSILLSLGLLLPINAMARMDEPVDADSKFYDYIIVGAGAAGSILARKLSDRNESVLVIDIGEFRYTDPVILDPHYLDHVNELTFDSRYAITYPVPVAPIQTLIYSEGQGTIGGGAAHNYMLSVRGTPGIFDGWAAVTGDSRWLYNSLLPKMKAVETYTPNGTSPNPAQRGFTGPISISQAPPLPLGPGAFYSNIATTGNAVQSTDYNDPTLGINVIGTPQSFVTPGPGHRSYSALEFLPMAPTPGAVIDANGNGLNGRDLKILTNARALKFNIEKDQAISVQYVRTFGSRDQVSTACLKDTGKLILTAGAVQTPKLLFLSGVGPAAELQALGIKMVVDSPHVGKNMQNQYGPLAFISVPAPIPTGEEWIDGSPHTVPTGKRLIQLLMLGSSNPGPGVFPILASLVNAKSRGSIDVVSANPLIEPNFNANMYSDNPCAPAPAYSCNGTDANLVVSALQIICDAVALTPGYSMLAPDASICHNPAKLFAYATSVNAWLIQSHATGTTRMGTSIANSVVDGRLKVHGLDNVYIGDIGVEPDNTDGNTCSGAYYIALELANILGYPTPPAL